MKFMRLQPPRELIRASLEDSRSQKNILFGSTKECHPSLAVCRPKCQYFRNKRPDLFRRKVHDADDAAVFEFFFFIEPRDLCRRFLDAKLLSKIDREFICRLSSLGKIFDADDAPDAHVDFLEIAINDGTPEREENEKTRINAI